jgi:pimeloyl-ACP methyl ester carboxylesterase
MQDSSRITRTFASHYEGKYEVLLEDNDKTYLRSPYPTEYRESSRIVLYTFRGGTKGTLLFIHGLGRYNMRFLTYFPRWFASKGYSTALMILPYHFDRTPRGKKSGEMFLDTTDNITLRSRFEHAVVDTLASIDYMKDKFGYPLYLMGYSFGGMIATISAAFRNDLSGLSLVVTGGNFLHITWDSIVTKVFRVQYEQNKECNKEKCIEWHSENNFYAYIRNLKDPKFKLNTAPMLCYEYDPLAFAKFVKAPTIMFSALFDIFIPLKSSTELFHFLGSERKKRYLLPSGHITSYLIFRRFIASSTLKFFEKMVK